MSIAEEKTALRRFYLERRAATAESEQRQMDEKIRQNLFFCAPYRSCRLLLIYVSTEHEVDTRGIIRQAILEGKRVAVPRCVPATGRLEFCEIGSLEELAPGTMGIPEPAPDASRLIWDFADSLCLVPGLCFDRLGYRVGYGKGYYDRFLADFGGDSLGL